MDQNPIADLRPAVRAARQQFLRTVEPLRPDLFRYARGLTPTIWEAEDLVQEALTRAFANLGRLDGVRNVRAYLFRIATNAWLDEQARRRPQLLTQDHDAPDEAAPVPAVEVGEALEKLVRRLPPRERAAVLLRDVFGFSAKETAEALRTTVGAVKAALFRGRQGLEEDTMPKREPLRSEVVDAFVAAFNARDIDALLGLMATEATTEIVGVAADPGPDAARNVIARTLEEETLLHAEAVAVRGDPVVVLWYRGDAVGDVVRIEHSDGRVTRYRSYYFAPDVLEAVGEELGVSVRTQGYTVNG